MRRQTTVTLLSLLVLASACNKSNYAQVEPDDLYFSHKDRKEAVDNYAIAATSEAATEVASTRVESATPYQPNTAYSNQHAPVLTSPSYGSPTIQQYDQRPYYDDSVNPDYLYDQEYSGTDLGSDEYYVEDYKYNEPQYTTSTDPQIVNNYYGISPYSVSAYANNYNYNMMYPYGYSYDPYRAYRPRGWAMMVYGFGYSPYYSSYYDPFGYSPWYYDNYYYNSVAYGSYYSCYAPVGNTYYNNYNSGNAYVNGTKYLAEPRKSRSTVSYYANKDDVSIKRRREDYIPSVTSESGRVASRTTVEPARPTAEPASYTRRSSSMTYQPETNTTDNVAAGRKPASVTVQQYRNRTRQNTSTTVNMPAQNRTNYARNSNVSQQRRTTINTSQPVISNGSYSRQAARSGYNSSGSSSSRSSYVPSNYGSSYRNSGGSSSGYNSRSSSYQPRSTSSPSRSSYTPSRSTSTPTRSAPSRSTPTRSSSSSSSSGPKRN